MAPQLFILILSAPASPIEKPAAERQGSKDEDDGDP
jgi:hypothetical protein